MYITGDMFCWNKVDVTSSPKHLCIKMFFLLKSPVKVINTDIGYLDNDTELRLMRHFAKKAIIIR